MPITDVERELLEKDELQTDPSVEVNPELARHYFSSWDKMMEIFGKTKEVGEKDFVKFLEKYAKEYADCYADMGSRSYQSNASRVSGTLINEFVKDKNQNPEDVRIIDVASGPEMLRNHIGEEYEDRVVSIDINASHFRGQGGQRIVGSFLKLPFKENSVDYANLSLALHYTNFVPSKNKFERLELLQGLNVMLKEKGRAVIELIYSLDLRDEEKFKNAVEALGFRVVDEYNGIAVSANNFRSRVITLEKVAQCPKDMDEILQKVGGENLDGLKFAKKGARLADSRKVITEFSLGDKTTSIRLNEQDQVVLEEEQKTLEEGADLKNQWGSIKDIPGEEVIRNGFVRIFNGSKYILFKKLSVASGAVVIR